MNRRGFKTAVGVGLSVMLAASAMSGCSKAGNEDAVKTEAAKAEDTKSAGESSQAESGSEDGKGAGGKGRPYVRHLQRNQCGSSPSPREKAGARKDGCDHISRHCREVFLNAVV